MQLLTAEEMAKILKCSVKTFYRRVRKYNVPSVDGGQRLFNPEKVLSCLETTPTVEISLEPQKRRKFALNVASDKYGKLLGL